MILAGVSTHVFLGSIGLAAALGWIAADLFGDVSDDDE